MKKFYTVYKITNLLNTRIYIGAHSTDNLNDKYMGSSKELKRDIREKGIENFKKEILYIYDLVDEMLEKESELIEEILLYNINSYNIKNVSFDLYNLGKKRIRDKNGNIFSVYKDDIRYVNKNILGFYDDLILVRNVNDENKKHFFISKEEYHNDDDDLVHIWIGRTHTEETKNKCLNLNKENIMEKRILNMIQVGFII